MEKYEYEILLSSGDNAWVFACDFHEAMEKALRVTNEHTEDVRVEKITAM